MAAGALFDGVIAEMKTGEGKTLAIALGACLAATAKKGVHIATPNPYLATRDTEAMRPLYEFLGLTVGTTVPGLSLAQKQAAYNSDVLYGVHSELGFDYLRDHLGAKAEQRVQRELYFAIVDEADSILIDEARTPLIITEPSTEHVGTAYVCDRIAQQLQVGPHVIVDHKARSAHLTEQGFERAAQGFKATGLIQTEQALYRPDQLHLMRQLEAALRARLLYQRDRDYVVHNGEVLIVDESTGRTLAGRRWQGGVHQAIEIREGLKVQSEPETVAEITYQNYFGLYLHLAGLTGTALTAAEEFEELYGRGTLPIPTHRPMIRRDLSDRLYSDRAAKFRAIVDDVHDRHSRGQPVLIGTGSVQESEALAAWFSWAKLPHRVLNARQNAEEAQIIQDAGRLGAITIATNMAGRGTDIVLGGAKEGEGATPSSEEAVIQAGGLHIIGTQRHESRRVDDQLRGRAGRQGNPGSSQFFLSLEDDLLRIFGASHFERLAQLVAQPGQNFAQGALIKRAVQRAQAAMEGVSFGARRQLVKTDRVIASQRNEVYAYRDSIILGEYTSSDLEGLISAPLERLIEEYSEPADTEDEDTWALLQESVQALYHVDLSALSGEVADLKETIVESVLAHYRAARGTDAPDLTEKERLCLLSALDRAWREHLTYVDSLREGMHLKGYAQQNPDHEFAKEARAAFDSFLIEYENRAVALLTTVTPIDAPLTSAAPAPVPSRLAPCLCGSGRRFKHCHGQLLGWPRSQLAVAG
jgi:preprotein translocase subunit SecA